MVILETAQTVKSYFAYRTAPFLVPIRLSDFRVPTAYYKSDFVSYRCSAAGMISADTERRAVPLQSFLSVSAHAVVFTACKLN